MMPPALSLVSPDARGRAGRSIDTGASPDQSFDDVFAGVAPTDPASDITTATATATAVAAAAAPAPALLPGGVQSLLTQLGIAPAAGQAPGAATIVPPPAPSTPETNTLAALAPPRATPVLPAGAQAIAPLPFDAALVSLSAVIGQSTSSAGAVTPIVGPITSMPTAGDDATATPTSSDDHPDASPATAMTDPTLAAMPLLQAVVAPLAGSTPPAAKTSAQIVATVSAPAPGPTLPSDPTIAAAAPSQAPTMPTPAVADACVVPPSAATAVAAPLEASSTRPNATAVTPARMDIASPEVTVAVTSIASAAYLAPIASSPPMAAPAAATPQSQSSTPATPPPAAATVAADAQAVGPSDPPAPATPATSPNAPAATAAPPVAATIAAASDVPMAPTVVPASARSAGAKPAQARAATATAAAVPSNAAPTTTTASTIAPEPAAAQRPAGGSSSDDALTERRDAAKPVETTSSSDASPPSATLDATIAAGHQLPSATPSVQTIAKAVTSLAQQASSSAAPGAATNDAGPTQPAPQPARSLTLQLSPASLGNVTVRLHLTSGGLDVRVGVEEPKTLGLITHARDELSAAISSDGTYRLDSLVIQGADASTSSMAGSNDQAKSGGTRDGQGSGATARDNQDPGSSQGSGHQGSGAGSGSSPRDNRGGARPGAARDAGARGADGLFV